MCRRRKQRVFDLDVGQAAAGNDATELRHLPPPLCVRRPHPHGAVNDGSFVGGGATHTGYAAASERSEKRQEGRGKGTEVIAAGERDGRRSGSVFLGD